MLTDEEKNILALYGVPGVGARTYARLVSRFGSPESVFNVSKRELMEMDGIGNVIADNILNFNRDTFVSDQIKLMEQSEATMLTRSSDDYPPLLNTFKSAPPVLFLRGDAATLSLSSLAFVGTRKPSGYGVKMTMQLVEASVDAGLCIVSGMAAGIDATAHRAALDSGGKTVAVFGCGVDIIYPTANRKLSENIINSGCLVSHFPMGTVGLPGNFPARNAVVAGLSLGTVVVEAPKTSGALITANLTLKAGRKLFAVPGNADSPKSVGANNLIARGAYPVFGAETILTKLGKPFVTQENKTDDSRKISRSIPPGLAGEILGILSEGPLQVEVIYTKLGKPVTDILNELTLLEMDNYVTQKPGKFFERR